MEQKSTRFYTGVPCAKGHVVERLVSSGECVECKRVREKRLYRAEDGKRRKQHYKRNREEKLNKQRAYDAARVEEKLEYGRAWRALNKERTQLYRRKNAGLYAFHAALRRKRVQRATMKWTEFEQIKELYLDAAERGMQVDHVVPLAGKNVCGLHVLANLQLLTESENKSKRNRF